MTRRLSDWSKPGEKPPRVGVWETKLKWQSNLPYRIFQHWNGMFYGLGCASPEIASKYANIASSEQEIVRFRGLADKPE